jgi:AAA domain
MDGPDPGALWRELFDQGGGGGLVDQGTPTRWDAVDLLAVEFPPQQWVVDEMIPTGLGILSGPPKQGKSFLALQLAVTVAVAAPFLDHSTHPGRVLFLALEDGARRAQHRLRMIPEHRQLPPGVLEIRTAAPTVDSGLIADLERWRTAPGEPAALIVVDVFQRVRDPGAGRDRYAEDYAAVSGLQQWANRNGVTVLILHHNRKMAVTGDDDPFAAVSGSTGLTGAVDVVLVLRGSRGAPEAALFVSGRDVGVSDSSLVMENGLWRHGDMPIELVTLPARSRMTRDVWRFLNANGPQPTQVIADHVKTSANALSKRLRRVEEESGWIVSDGKPSPGRPVFWEAFKEPPQVFGM